MCRKTAIPLKDRDGSATVSHGQTALCGVKPLPKCFTSKDLPALTEKRTGKVDNVPPCRTSCPGYGYVLNL